MQGVGPRWRSRRKTPMSFHLKPIPEVQTRDEARDISIEWQRWQSEQSMSWGEVLEYQVYFEELAKKFDLEEEFRENGI
jgi:hypothetical protein